MKYFAGIDLHSNNHYIGIIDQDGKKVFQDKLSNDLDISLTILKPFKKNLKGVVVESTFNWYWLVDGLMEAGYKVHLANPNAIQQYNGLKYSDDKSDAFWLAEMLRLNILKEGYIYPKEIRGIRDLLRKRMLLVRYRTALMLSLKGMFFNLRGDVLSRRELQKITGEEIEEIFEDPHYKISGRCLKDVVNEINNQITKIEKIVLKKVRLTKDYENLTSVPGIGDILSITIMLETGPISRFFKAGNYSSYCRCVSSKRLSNDKSKGKGNTKNGNRYLAWAYVEASHFMRRFCPRAQRWHQRKKAKSGEMVATKTLGNKIARACYYIMRDKTIFDSGKLFH